MNNENEDLIYQYEPLWGSWKIDNIIGRGSIGNVYKVHKKVLDKKQISAVKFISIPTEDQYENFLNMHGNSENLKVEQYFQDIVNRIVNEINLLYDLRGSTNIISYEDCLVHKLPNKNQWHILIRMEYAKTLKDYVNEKKFILSEKEIIKIGSDLCDALNTCHNKEILHRDIKEANVFISERGEFKLGDFSVSKDLNENTSAHTRVGTVNYMSPEIIKGEKYDKRADIYSLGLMLYKLVNYGRLPFLPSHDKNFAIFDLEASQNKRLLGKKFNFPENASKDLAMVIMKACAYNQSNRYKTAIKFKEALNQVLDNQKTKSNTINDDETINAETEHKLKYTYKLTFIQRYSKKIILTLLSIIFVLSIFSTVLLFIIKNSSSSDRIIDNLSSDSITQKSVSKIPIDSSSSNYSKFVSSDKEIITSTSPYNEFQIWDSSSYDLIDSIKINTSIYSFNITQDRKNIATYNNIDEIIEIINISSRKTSKTFENIELNSSNFILSNDLNYLAYVDNNSINIVELKNPNNVTTLTGHTDDINDFSFSDDSKTLISISSDGTIKVWDISRGKIEENIKTGDSQITTFSLSGDTKTAVITTENEENNISIWDLDSGEKIRTILGVENLISNIKISEDGTKIAFPTSGSTIYIYSTSTGACISKLKSDNDSYTFSSSSYIDINSKSNKILTSNIIFDITSGD